MRTSGEVALAAVLVIWFGLTVIGQLGRRGQWLRLTAVGWAIPHWWLFAPAPAHDDFHLVYRTRTADSRIGAMVEPPLCWRSTRVSALWNPAARRQKMLRDVANAALRAAAATGADAPAVYSPAYALLLGVAVEHAGRPVEPGTHLQFAVLSETPGSGFRCLLLSQWHEL